MPSETVVANYLNALSSGDFPGIRALLSSGGTFGKDNSNADAYTALLQAGGPWIGASLLKGTFSGFDAAILYQGNNFGQTKLASDFMVIQGDLIQSIRGMTVGAGTSWLDPSPFASF